MELVKFPKILLRFFLQLIVSCCLLLFLKLALFAGEIAAWSAYFKRCLSSTCPAGIICDCAAVPDFLMVELIGSLFSGDMGLLFALMPFAVVVGICLLKRRFPWEISERNLRWAILVLLAISINGLISFWLSWKFPDTSLKQRDWESALKVGSLLVVHN
jgi:hypothetical protein